MKKNTSFRHILALELNSLKKTIFLDKNTYSLGRNSTNSIVVHHRVVSRNHATFLKITYKEKEENKDVFWIVDGDLRGNRSTNGIYVNGEKCFSHELKPGDLIIFGGVDVKAKYDMVDVSAKIFLSAFKEEEKTDNLNIEEGETESLRNQSKSTFVQDEEDIKEILVEEFTSKISSADNLFSFPIVEINLEGEITKTSESAENIFPDLKNEKLTHPILHNINQVFQDNVSNLVVRQLEVNNNNYTQYAYVLEDKKTIKSYVLDNQKLYQLNLILKENEERYHSLVKEISEGIFILDIVSKKVLDANPAYCKLLGYSLNEILKLSIYDLVAINNEILHKDLQRIIKQKVPFIRESIHKRKNNSLVNVEVSVSFIYFQGKNALCFAVRDITDRKRAEEIFRYQASHDILTSLPNQKLFYEQLSTSLGNAESSREVLALMFIKLERLKNINYSLGHNIGDKLLLAFIKRIKKCLRSTDILARWGGDEFTLLLPEIGNADNVANISQSILERLKEPFIVNNNKIHLNISLGISIYPQHGKDAFTLLKNADAALYHTQKKIGSKYRFFTPQMTAKAKENIQIETLLHSAIKNNRLELFYKPQIDVITGEIVEYEAVVKWKDSKLGEINSERFLSIARENGLIVPLNYWILKTACGQNQKWQESELPPITVGVKIYPSCLEDINFLSRITEILTETELDSSFLNLQIKETNIIQNWESCAVKLKDLNKMGIQISLDDFGAENSSLNYLRKFSFNNLKIASSFVKNVDQLSENSAIISAIITLALAFNLQVVATGVTTVEEMELLIKLQCRYMEGSLFSQPLNLENATDFLSGKNETLTKIVNDKTIFNMANMKKTLNQ